MRVKNFEVSCRSRAQIISCKRIPYQQDTLAEDLNILDSLDHGLGVQRSKENNSGQKEHFKVFVLIDKLGSEVGRRFEQAFLICF